MVPDLSSSKAGTGSVNLKTEKSHGEIDGIDQSAMILNFPGWNKGLNNKKPDLKRLEKVRATTVSLKIKN